MPGDEQAQHKTTPVRLSPHTNTHERIEKLSLLLALGRDRLAAAWRRLGYSHDEAQRRAEMGESPDGR